MRHDEASRVPVADSAAASDPVDIGAYCRQVEAHLCRVNGGHLVRIVGPAFELVAGWAREGIPLRIVLHGVDRTVTRLTAKGPRRRPVRIEFCEADVRDAHDQWRKAVGVRVARAAAHGPDAADPGAPPPSRQGSLPKHLERVLVRLSALAATRDLPPELRRAVESTIAAVDTCLDAARGARGAARLALVEQLASIDAALVAAAVDALDEATRSGLEAQVVRELAPYRATMPPDAFVTAAQALRGELARRHHALPQVRVDG